MRLQLSLIALTWAPVLAQYACTICRDGVGLTKPDGMVTTRQGQTAKCEALSEHIVQLSQDACEDLQNLAMGPCGCPGYEASAGNMLAPITIQRAPEASEQVSAESETESFVCSICETGEMKNPTAYTINSIGMPTSCQGLNDSRESLSESACARVRSFAATPCGCDGGDSATIDTLLQFNSDPYACSICGNGMIGNPNGVVVNSRGLSRTCAELESNKDSVPSSMCPDLQNAALEPCECVFGETLQNDLTVNSIREFSDFTQATESEAANQNAVLVIEEDFLSECSICGDGETTFLDGIITLSDGRAASCDALEASTKKITSSACANIQNLAKQPCGCVFPFQETNTDVIPYECSICGNGAVTIPNGVVTTPQGQVARCSALVTNAKTISEDICPNIQQLSNGPCGCTNPEITSAEQVAPSVGLEIDGTEVCHVCRGATQKVGNPAKMVTTPAGMFTCYTLFSAGLGGAISTEDCGAVQTVAEQECGCYADEATVAPSDTFQCSICGDGLYVTKPEGIIKTENSITCAEYQQEAIAGRIDKDQCSALQQISSEACMCQPPPTFPTEAPTSYECQVCGRGKEIGSPDAEVMLPNYVKMSCATLQERAETGEIHISQCARFVPIAQQYCNCVDKAYETAPVALSDYDCNICGEGLKVTNPSGVVSIPNQDDRRCIELMTEAAYGTINESQCFLLNPYVQGPCGCADPYAGSQLSSSVESSVATPVESPAVSPTETLSTEKPSDKRGDCFQDLGEIQALERAIQNTSVTRMYVLCPGKTFDIGVWTEEGEIKDGQPFLALRPNVIYQCGHDGSRTNDCTLKGGDFGLASYAEVYDGINESVPGVQIRGLTFESQNLFSVILKSAGDITFTGCAFKGNSNNAPVLMQWDEKEDVVSETRRLEDLEELKQVVTFQDCVFRDNFVDDSSGFPGIIENTFNSELIVKNCLFQDNVYGSKNNLAGTGYAIRSFGPLTLESTCFIDNVFLNNGPVLVYGAQYTAYDNYVESPQNDLTCELGALFSSQDDMAETTPSCESSDASVCAFTQGPTTSPTIAPEVSEVGSSSATTGQSNQATSAASVTGRPFSTVGAAFVPVLLAFCISIFGL